MEPASETKWVEWHSHHVQLRSFGWYTSDRSLRILR